MTDPEVILDALSGVSQPIEVVLPGRPVPWARAGTKKGVHYTPEKQKRHRRDLAILIRAAARARGIDKLKGPVQLTVVAEYGALQQTKLYIRQEVTDIGEKQPVVKTPDVDNLLKQAMEALEDSGLIDNDKQVWKAVVMKIER